jgi:hypothetical protein
MAMLNNQMVNPTRRDSVLPISSTGAAPRNFLQIWVYGRDPTTYLVPEIQLVNNLWSFHGQGQNVVHQSHGYFVPLMAFGTQDLIYCDPILFTLLLV